MGEAQSSFDRNQAEEDIITFDPKHQRRMDDLFLVVDNPDDIDCKTPYPMALRPFPPSFWEHSIGDNRSQYQSHNNITQIPTIIQPPAKRLFLDPSYSQHVRSKSCQQPPIMRRVLKEQQREKALFHARILHGNRTSALAMNQKKTLDLL